MKKNFLFTVLFLFSAITAIAGETSNDLKKNFGDFIGKYKIVSCESLLNKERGEDKTLCSLPYAEIYFAGGYIPTIPGENLFMNVTDTFGFPGSAMWMAYEKNEPDRLCSTFYGVQGCSSLEKGYVVNTSIKAEQNGDLSVNWALTWLSAKSYLYRSISLKLRKME